MVHATATDRHNADQRFFDHCLQHVHGGREPHRGHYSDPGWFRGRRRTAPETGVPSLLQHNHRPGDHRRRRLYPSGVEHADFRRHLLSERSWQETRCHWLHAERPGIVADDHPNVHEVLRESATDSGATTVVHDPSEKSLYPGTAAPAYAGCTGLRASAKGAIRSRDQQHPSQGFHPAETARPHHELT